MSCGRPERNWISDACSFNWRRLSWFKKDSQKTEARLYAKLQGKQVLAKEEQMEFIILPLACKGKAKKQACIRRCFEMAKQLT